MNLRQMLLGRVYDQLVEENERLRRENARLAATRPASEQTYGTPYWPAVRYVQRSIMPNSYGLSSVLYATEEAARASLGKDFVRLAKECVPILLPRPSNKRPDSRRGQAVQSKIRGVNESHYPSWATKK